MTMLPIKILKRAPNKIQDMHILATNQMGIDSRISSPEQTGLCRLTALLIHLKRLSQGFF